MRAGVGLLLLCLLLLDYGYYAPVFCGERPCAFDELLHFRNQQSGALKKQRFFLVSEFWISRRHTRDFIGLPLNVQRDMLSRDRYNPSKVCYEAGVAVPLTFSSDPDVRIHR